MDVSTLCSIKCLQADKDSPWPIKYRKKGEWARSPVGELKDLKKENYIKNTIYYLQGQAIKLSRFSDRHIYPCNGRTGPGKVSLEPHEYKEDFDMSQAKIGHSKLSLEQIDRREANLICAGHFLAILAIFG